MEQLLIEWKKFLKEASAEENEQAVANLVSQIQSKNGAIRLSPEQRKLFDDYIQQNRKINPSAAAWASGAMYVYYRDKESRNEPLAGADMRRYKQLETSLGGIQNYRYSSTTRGTDAFLGATEVPSIEKGLYSSKERPAFAKLIDDTASYFKSETGLNILDPSRPFTVPNWAGKYHPALYASLQMVADFAASDPFTLVQNATLVGAVEKYAAVSLTKKELSVGLEQIGKEITTGSLTKEAAADKVKQVLQRSKEIFKQTIDNAYGGFSPKERAYWAERYNASKAAHLKNVDKVATPDKAKKVAQTFKSHLEKARDLAKLSDNQFIQKALDFTSEEGKKLTEIIYRHVRENYTFPKDLADRLFRIALSGKSKTISMYKGTAWKGISIDFAEQLVGEESIPKALGAHKVKLKKPIYIDPDQNFVRSYRSKYNYEQKSPVSEWTYDYKVAKDYSLNPMSAEAKKTLADRAAAGARETIAILEAEAIPGQNNFLFYEKLKGKALQNVGIDLSQAELLSYGKIRVDEIIIINQ